MNYDELCRKICEIEDEYDLFHLTFNRVAYWKYARYYIYIGSYFINFLEFTHPGWKIRMKMIL